jgi:hypothetical protein
MPDDVRLLCVSVHDVAPATLDDCLATLSFLDALRVTPVALLVVPDYHGLGRIDRDERFCEFLRARAARGDEIVLHGFRHDDASQGRAGLRDWMQRRVSAHGEGEFARLDSDCARSRILRGLVVLRSAGWHPAGFVAPAWLMSPGTYDALDSLSFQYCATRDAVLALDQGRRILAPSLVLNTGSRSRRGIAALWTQLRLARRSGSLVMRVALHPRDTRYRSIEALWRRLLSQLADRSIITEGELVRTALPRGSFNAAAQSAR